MRLWYLRRAVPWTAVGGACATAALLVVAVHRWPSSQWVLLPFALAACAGAAGFALDEAAATVVGVTARGRGWRVATRMISLVAPLTVWSAAVVSLTRLDAAGGHVAGRGTLWLAGVAACLLVFGLATTLTRLGPARPGSGLASAVAVTAALPLTVGPMLGWDPVYPIGDVADWVPTFWWGVAAVGAVLVPVGTVGD